MSVVLELGCVMFPCPPTTTPPVGPARAADSVPKVMNAAVTQVAARSSKLRPAG